MTALDWRDEDVRGFGMAIGGRGRVLRPTTAEQIADAFAEVRRNGGSVALRGTGNSYGDAATSTNGAMNLVTAAPTLPAPKMPSAVPCRSVGYQRDT